MNKPTFPLWPSGPVLGALISTAASMEIAPAVVDPYSVLGWFVFTLADVARYLMQLTPPGAVLLDTVVFFLQWLALLSAARWMVRQVALHRQRRVAAAFVGRG